MLNPNTRIAVVLGTLTEDVEDTLVTFIRILGSCSLAIILLSYVGGMILANRSLKPVEKITTAAKKIEETDLTQRINVKSND
jgi:nitrogen fixation/metabolism regulation signal transduction histidine kinase